MEKNWFKYFYTKMASVLLIGVYLLSYVGFSVHSCTCEESVQISILIGNPSCDDLHAHIPISKGEFHHCDHHHSEGCCSTEILVMTSEQTSPDHQSLFNSLSSGMVATLHYSDIRCDEHVSESVYLEEHTPLESMERSLSFLSVWRL